ncbi:MAG: type II toxin-antitoxin system VapC family toxin [Gemmatimonadetes bacterium]|nr:type II toxin-antitoxin system VapC family toxin [Gemmatimonadota bacterium]
MIFVDSNIPMYLVGAPHPNKEAARLSLERCITRGERLVTSAEVLQEILHRYHAIRRPDAIQPAFDALLGVVDEVYPIEAGDVQRARDVMMGLAKLSARDALHAAVMQRRGVERIMSFDAGFDALGWIERLG